MKTEQTEQFEVGDMVRIPEFGVGVISYIPHGQVVITDTMSIPANPNYGVYLVCNKTIEIKGEYLSHYQVASHD